MKFAWRNDTTDFVFSNMDVEEVDDFTKEYEDILAADEEQGGWDQPKDEILSWD